MAVQAGIVLERGVHLPQLAVHHPQVRVDQHRQGRVRLHLLHEPEGQAHLVRVPHVVLVTEHDVIRLIAKLLQQVHKVLLGAAEPAAGTVMGNPIRIPVGVFLQNGGGILSVVRQDQLPAPYILGQDGIHHGPDESAALIGRQQDQYLFFHGLILTQCPAAGQRNGPAPPAGQRFRQTPGGHSPACAGSPPPSFRPPGPLYPVPR